MEVRILTPADGTETNADWQKAGWLVLYGAALDGIAPVRDQNSSAGVSMPLDENEAKLAQIGTWKG